MTTQTVRPRGRRPGHDDTRGTIARSALELFDNLGYDGTSLRAIARNADVDPALVHHYFASKPHLFTIVLLDTDVDIVATIERAACAGDPETLGLRVAREFFDLWESPRFNAAFTAFLQPSGGADERRRLLGEFLAREVFGRLATAQGHSNGILRGQLAASTMLGLMTGRHVLEMGALSMASARSLVEPVGRALQHYLVEPW